MSSEASVGAQPGAVQSSRAQQDETTGATSKSERQKSGARPRAQPVTSNKSQQQSKQLAASLRAAANEGKVELVRLLLRCGADLNAQDEEFGNTALHQAAWNGFSETIQVLCKHRANTSIKNKALFTPLHLASQQGHNQSARLLLMANARAELKNSYGDTPLHTAARYGHAGVARILLSAKCNPNQVNKNNDTPLHIAAAMGRRKLTKILMQNGAELVIKNKQNETAMDIALRKDLIEIQELIANPPPKANHQQHSHNHHYHHHHHHHHHHQRNSAHRTAHRHEQQQRHHTQHYERRKSMTNLISLEGDGRGRPRGLSISSNNVQCADTGLTLKPARQLTSACDELADSGHMLVTGGGRQLLRASSRDFHSIDASTRPNEASTRPGLINAGRLRTRTLALGLGVSQAALDELVGRNRRTTGAEAGERSRPSSVGSRRRRAVGAEEDLNGCRGDNDDDDGQAAAVGAKVPGATSRRPSRLRSSPHGSMRSSRAGGRLRAARGIVVKPRRLTVAAGQSASVSQLTNQQVANQNCATTDQPQVSSLTTGHQRRCSSSVSILGGKLSLALLRKMVKKRATVRRLTTDAASCGRARTSGLNESSQRGDDNGGGHSRLASSKPVQTMPDRRITTASGGRRQERLERLLAAEDEATTPATDQMRAPNGAKLLTTKPLAPLSDETQLYAIPRKTSSKTTSKGELGAVSAAPSSASPAAATGRPPTNEGASQRDTAAEELPEQANNSDAKSGGKLEAALTASDSGHSMAGSNSTLDKHPARLVSSSSDEFIESLAAPGASRKSQPRRHQEDANSDDDDDDSDPLVPGYSVVRNHRAARQMRSGNSCAKTDEQPRDGPSDACICSLGSVEAPSDFDVATIRARPARNQQVVTTSHHCDEHDEQLVPKSGERRLSSVARDANHGHELEDGRETPAGLIRPKSVIEAANVELVAAQKSLAAAAAAKVNRDRLARLALLKQESSSFNEETPNSGCLQGNTSDHHSYGELRVKTSNPNNESSFWLQHHQRHQTLVAAAATRVRLHQDKPGLGELQSSHQLRFNLMQGASVNGMAPQTATTAAAAATVATTTATTTVASLTSKQRHDGSNSVGMSDSSPSNNGADSDNSIQTQTSGSMTNTENTISPTPATETPAGSNQQVQRSSSSSSSSQNKTTTAVMNGPVAKRDQSSNGGAFGILSRILLQNSSVNNSASGNSNENNNASKRTNNNISSKTANGLKRIVQSIAGSNLEAANGCGTNNNNNNSSDSDKATTTRSNRDAPSTTSALKAISKPQASFNGSLSSSSALSSPSVSTTGRSPNSTADGSVGMSDLQPNCNVAPVVDGAGPSADGGRTPSDAQSPLKALDQMDSRSRCPIVLGRASSNGLPTPAETTTGDASAPPRLPPKSVLKTSARLGCSNGGGVATGVHEGLVEPNALINGLPRVPSYTLLSSLQQQQLHHDNLCGYHAISRRHLIQPKYSPYLPYAHAGHYPLHHYPQAVGSSHVGAGSGNTITNGRYTPSGSNAARATPMQEANESLRNASMVCHHPYDDSIYIPSLNSYGLASNFGDGHNSRAHFHQAHTANSSVFAGESNRQPEQAHLARFDERLIALNQAQEQLQHNDYRYQQPAHLSNANNFAHQPPIPRPKSSFDSVCGQMGANLDSAHLDAPRQTPGLAGNANQPTAHTRFHGPRINAISHDSHPHHVQCAKTDLNQISNSSQLITQNSIYAPGGGYNQHRDSELTVLPTSHSQAGSSINKPTLQREPASINELHKLHEYQNGQSRTSTSSSNNSEEVSTEQPPKLPPKTTTTTVGKLTRVSINSTSGSTIQRSAHCEKSSQRDTEGSGSYFDARSSVLTPESAMFL